MKNETDSLRLENQLCFPLYAAARGVVRRYRPHLDALNLTYTQYIAMMVMWEERLCSVRELGKRLYLDSGTLTPVLKSLEQKGCVRRYRSPEDERVLLVELTENGRQLREACADIPYKVGCSFDLSAQDAQTLHRLLYQILGQFD